MKNQGNQQVVVAVFDLAVQAFGRPIFAPTIPAAARMFRDEVNREAADNPLNKHPEDYILWYLATFYEESGTFEPDSDGKRVIARAKDVQGDKQ